MRIIIAFLVLSAVVLFHEFGHYLLARANGIIVTEFSLGFGPRLISFVRGGTRYSWKLIPLGGSCAMLGEDADDDGPGSFNNASVLGRILVVAAGPVFNFILAFIIGTIIICFAGTDRAYLTEVPEDSAAYAAGLRAGDLVTRYRGNGIANASELAFDVETDGVPTDEIRMTVRRAGEKIRVQYHPETEVRYLLGFSYGQGTDGEAQILRVNNKSPLQKAGAEAGDVITSVNGTETPDFRSLVDYFEARPLDGSEVTLGLLRGNERLTITAAPQEQEVAELGFSVNYRPEKVSFPQAIRAGIGETGYWIHVVVKSLTGLVRGVFSVREMSGPVGIVNVIGESYETARAYGLRSAILTLLNMIVMLSANLGVMNLLPLPALDGGRLIFLFIEAIRRKPLRRELEGMIHFVGFAALMALIIFISFQDIQRLF